MSEHGVKRFLRFRIKLPTLSTAGIWLSGHGDGKCAALDGTSSFFLASVSLSQVGVTDRTDGFNKFLAFTLLKFSLTK